MKAKRTLTPSKIRAFQKKILSYHRDFGRDLPWHKTRNPYRILVSEIMLQQTQVDRVVLKYQKFLKLFPRVSVLAKASLAEVFRAWQGLGYNRRALYLKQAAEIIVKKYRGKIPEGEKALKELPGVGEYTARAIETFAFGKKAVFIETNIRSVFIHFFFPKMKRIPDSKLLPLIAGTLPPKNSRRWYLALMDYGVMLKQKGGNPSRHSLSYTKQSPFKGSRRELRGKIIKLLTERSRRETFILKMLGKDVRRVLFDLEREGFVVKSGGIYHLPY